MKNHLKNQLADKKPGRWRGIGRVLNVLRFAAEQQRQDVGDAIRRPGLLLNWRFVKQRSRGHLLRAGVISIRLRHVFTAENFQTLFLATSAERPLRINTLCDLCGLRPVFLLVSTLPLITPRPR